jgi:hypothetical protein
MGRLPGIVLIGQVYPKAWCSGENMEGLFAFLRLVLSGSKPGIVFKYAAEMRLVIESGFVGNIR